MAVHDGHRERMRERFFQNGLDGFTEIEALELLLYYAIPRQDTNPLSHSLLDHFGNLDYVLSASEQELCEVPGVGKHTAALIMLVRQMARRGELSRTARIHTLNSVEAAASYLIPQFHGQTDEIMLLLCLDSQMRLIHSEVVSRGVVNAVIFDTRKIAEIALRRKAACILLAHNHPNGPASPSHEDDNATRSIMRALEALNIQLFDHIIVWGSTFFSYRSSGMLALLRYP